EAGSGQLATLRPEVIRVGDPDRQDRRARPQRKDRQTVLGLLEGSARATRSFGKDPQHMSLVEDPLGEPEALDVRGAAPDPEHPVVAEPPADERPAEGLLLA